MAKRSVLLAIDKSKVRPAKGPKPSNLPLMPFLAVNTMEVRMGCRGLLVLG